MYFIAGGAGFIGSHLTVELTRIGHKVKIYDNFSSGRKWHLLDADKDNMQIIEGDIKDTETLVEAMHGCEIVYHFASNPDIAKAMAEPTIDFWEGTYLTQNILEAMRITGTKRILYASGSGIYGDTGNTPVFEEYSPLLPISTYGASKLSCEALICSYCHLFDIKGAAFRFANVVGPHQTHGVAYDFVRSLITNPETLFILGNGLQSKSYIYVGDVLAAMRLVEQKSWEGFCYYNVATMDYITVHEIADMVAEALGLQNVEYKFGGGSRGWKGDVPVVRFNTQKIRKIGWANKYSSRQSLQKAILSIIEDAKLKHFDW